MRKGFAQPNHLVTFFDNHDNPAHSVDGRGCDGGEAGACRGVPVVYYATSRSRITTLVAATILTSANA